MGHVVNAMIRDLRAKMNLVKCQESDRPLNYQSSRPSYIEDTFDVFEIVPAEWHRALTDFCETGARSREIPIKRHLSG